MSARTFEALLEEDITFQDTACTSRFEITNVFVHGTEGRTGSDASPLHGAAQTGKPLRLHSVARMYGCCLTANRTSILQQNLSHRDPNGPEVHDPLCASCTAARTCTACPTWTIAQNCTNPCSGIASFTWLHVTVRQFPENTLQFPRHSIA